MTCNQLNSLIKYMEPLQDLLLNKNGLIQFYPQADSFLIRSLLSNVKIKRLLNS